MFKSILDKIINQPDRYNIDLWSYRLSGNILEIIAKPKYSQDPDHFRIAVIRSGQVLQSIYHQAMLKNQNAMIQSFPNMEETRLIAVIRLQKADKNMDSKQFDKLKYNRDSGNSQSYSSSQILKAVASHQGMFLQPLQTNPSDLSKQEEILSDLSIELADKSCFGLCGTSDNPFIWLKTGYWVERNRQLSDENSSFTLPDIYDNIP
ncbi:MAG: hypothetical protein WD599_00280, partial [Balneolaceae bacterium]